MKSKKRISESSVEPSKSKARLSIIFLPSKGIRFLLYLILIVLLNMVCNSLFFRIDLTEKRIYSLSSISKRLVANLKEPLTIKAFFSKNLPQPYNNIEQQLRDLLEEYALCGNQFFNYTITSIDHSADTQGGASSKAVKEFEEEARNYSIYPIQIQNIEQDEVTLQNAYMGVAFIHGNMMERIPALASAENLEYRITGMIKRLSSKIDTLLSLDEDVQVKLVLSSSLYKLGGNLRSFPGELEAVVTELNKRNYGRLRFTHIDPLLQPEGIAVVERYRIKPLILTRVTGDREQKEEAYASVVVAYKENAARIELIKRGLFGYQLTDPTKLDTEIERIVERIIGVNEEIGYLSDYDCPPLRESYVYPESVQRVSLQNFDTIVSQTYTLKELSLKREDVPKGLSSLVIVGPREKIDDYSLFQIDQFIMRSNAVAFFIDTHMEIISRQSDQRSPLGAQPVYIPLATGLDRLLEHYGVSVKKSYVMDTDCFVQRTRLATGGVQEIPFYFAPKIGPEGISKEHAFMQNIKGLVMLNVSPLELTRESGNGLKATLLVSSSPKSWEVSENINLYNPLLIQPPSKKEDRGPRALAYLLEGHFSSYFKDREIPVRPSSEQKKEGAEDVTLLSEDKIKGEVEFIPETNSGKIFVVGTSEILGDNVLDRAGSNTNATLILNLLDYLNGQEDFAVMRSKGQRYNPLRETELEVRTSVKTFNIAGLPIIVILIGVVVWLRWMAKKKRLQSQFEGITYKPTKNEDERS
jgi:ABC-2 type transport system permease protein